MKEGDLLRRTKAFSVAVIRFFDELPKDEACRVIGRQLLRAGTSVSANYRAARRAKSTADFISKMGTVEEEADESALWLELLTDAGKVPAEKVKALQAEATELTAIAVASIKTARGGSR